MSTLFGRRYARPAAAISRTEKTVGVVILVLVVGLVATFITDVTRRSAPRLQASTMSDAQARKTVADSHAFPALDLADWRSPTGIERFSADELYVKIDGQAEAYLSLGVVGLNFGTYSRRDDDTRTIDVYWYDMGSPESAGRVFQQDQPPDRTVVSIGDAAYVSAGAAFFRVGRHYVQVLPAQSADAEVAHQIAERLAASIAQPVPTGRTERASHEQ
ncbi:MAG TPA: hypothetical protein PLP66_08535 [Phycisphaerae bacterium]|nr:hypothetical protein [Phycisphaerae bacterium]